MITDVLTDIAVLSSICTWAATRVVGGSSRCTAAVVFTWIW